MVQLSKIEVLNKLQVKGFTVELYHLGLLTSKTLTYANAYNHMRTLESTGQTRPEAVKLTAARLKISRRSMYNVTEDMETKLQITTTMENLLSKI